MKAPEWIFKMALLIIGVGFLVTFFLFTQNNRYQQINQKFGEVSFCVLDKKEGDIHVFYYDSEKGWKFYILNTQDAKIKYKDVTVESIQPSDLE